MTDDEIKVIDEWLSILNDRSENFILEDAFSAYFNRSPLAGEEQVKAHKIKHLLEVEKLIAEKQTQDGKRQFLKDKAIKIIEAGGWTNFHYKLAKEEESKSNADKMALEKLTIELKTVKRQAKMYWPLTIIAIVSGLCAVGSIIFSVNKEEDKSILHSLKSIETRVDTLELSMRNIELGLQKDNNDSSKHILFYPSK